MRLILLFKVLEWSIHIKGKQLNCDSINTFISDLGFSIDMKLDIQQRVLGLLLTSRHNFVMWFSNVNTKPIVIHSNSSLKLVAKEPSIETIAGFLLESKKWDFPKLAFKWLYLNQLKSIFAEACNCKNYVCKISA